MQITYSAADHVSTLLWHKESVLSCSVMSETQCDSLVLQEAFFHSVLSQPCNS